jgi:hypothetical protein
MKFFAILVILGAILTGFKGHGFDWAAWSAAALLSAIAFVPWGNLFNGRR